MFVTVDKDVEIKLMYSLDLRTLLPVNWAQQACIVCVCSPEADYTPRPLFVEESEFIL